MNSPAIRAGFKYHQPSECEGGRAVCSERRLLNGGHGGGGSGMTLPRLSRGAMCEYDVIGVGPCEGEGE